MSVLYVGQPELVINNVAEDCDTKGPLPSHLGLFASHCGYATLGGAPAPGHRSLSSMQGPRLNQGNDGPCRSKVLCKVFVSGISSIVPLCSSLTNWGAWQHVVGVGNSNVSLATTPVTALQGWPPVLLPWPASR